MTQARAITGRKAGVIPDIARAEARRPIPTSTGRVAAVLTGRHGAVAVSVAVLAALDRLAGADRYKSRPDRWTCGGRADITIAQMQILEHHGFASSFAIQMSGRFAAITTLGRAALAEHEAAKAKRRRKP